MSRDMPRRVAIWTDHREAILVVCRGEKVTREEELFSEAGPHTHGGGWAEHRIKAHRHELLKPYYEQVIRHVGPVDEILIVGPGQAKHELHQSIDHQRGLKGRVVAVRTASRLAEQEVIAEADQFFDSEIQESQSWAVSGTKKGHHWQRSSTTWRILNPLTPVASS